MTMTRIEQAVTALRAAYGSVDLPGPGSPDASTWSRLLRVLSAVPGDHAATASLNDLLQSSPLSSPRETVAASTGQLLEILKPIPRGPQKASVVRAVASWWLEQFGDELTPEWRSSVATYRESLRQIRGLGPATVDEVLLFAADLPVFPVDRSALRVAVRHGWLDLPVEEDDAQSLFVSDRDQPASSLQELSILLSKVGHSHCGREPQCEGCPLQGQLPTGGPRNPSSC